MTSLRSGSTFLALRSLSVDSHRISPNLTPHKKCGLTLEHKSRSAIMVIGSIA